LKTLFKCPNASSKDYTSGTRQNQTDSTLELRDITKTPAVRRNSDSQAILVKDIYSPSLGIWKSVKVDVDSQKSGASENVPESERRADW
jgi:hypothetical protein